MESRRWAALLLWGYALTAFPSAGAYTENGITQGTLRQRHDDQLAATRQLVGAGPVQALTIASGALTPAAGASGSIVMDTEGAASTDRLSNISTSNLPDGSHVLLRIADNGRVITVGDTDGGAGQIALVDGLDFEMNRVGQWLELRRSGSDWTEVRRGGREKEHQIGAAGEPAYQNSWADAGLGSAARFWKDASGLVYLAGGVAKTNPGTNEVLFQLPAGYRPANAISAIVPALIGLGWDTAFNTITVATGGNVTWDRPAGDPGTGAQTVYLSITPFRAGA